MVSEWLSCKPTCGGCDRTSDTVRVDVSALANATSAKENLQPFVEKENMQPLQLCKSNEPLKYADIAARGGSRQQREEAERRQREQEQEAEEAERREAAERRREEERAAAEQAAAEAAAAAAEAERLEAERAAAEQAAAEAAAAAEEAERLQREEADRIEKERAREEREAAERLKVDAWCKELGFPDMHSKKSSFMGGTKYPLHKAVSSRNEEMVELLMQFGADRDAKNSKGQTPMELAAKINKGGHQWTKGSMERILVLLA